MKKQTTDKVPDDNVLWTKQNIADFLGMSLYTTRATITNRPDFPKPVKIGRPKWYPSQVKEWVFNQQLKE